MELCKTKPENPVVWLAGQLKGTNPNAQVDSTLGETEASKVEVRSFAWGRFQREHGAIFLWKMVTH